MLDALNQNIIAPLFHLLGGSLVFILTNFTAVLIFVLALLVIRRVFAEKRNPSNFYAWFLLVIFIPVIGVPLYFMFGGRKSRKLTELKREVTQRSLDLCGFDGCPVLGESESMSALDSSSRVSQGNHFELLADGEAAYKRLCQEIENAEHSIYIATYIFGNDASGRGIVDRLVQRASEGVTVRLLLDSLGSWNSSRSARYRIRKAGGQVAMFMPVIPIQTHTSSNLRNHRKIAIFDHYRAITGGQNIDTRFMGEEPDPNRFTDFSVVTQGPAVANLTRTFISDWAFTTKESPEDHIASLEYKPEEAGNSTIECISSGPDLPDDPLWEQVIRVIQEFKQHLTIITPYFIPDEVILHSLIVKARTGRRIRIIIPLRSNQWLTDIARYRHLEELNAAGVEIYFYKPRMLHAKLIIADDIVAITGSANIDMRSLLLNFEIALLHYTSSDVAELKAWSEKIQADCITYEEASSDPSVKPNKLIQQMVQLLEPLL